MSPPAQLVINSSVARCPTQLRIEAEAWLLLWEESIRTCDFEKGAALFAEDVVGFGSYSDILQGLEALRERQWRAIWPRTRSFAFDRSTLLVQSDRNGSLVVLCGLWSSEGIVGGGEAYPRRGRATLVLARVDGRLKAVHTHFSMMQGYFALQGAADQL